jgi:hypothetical protein
MKKFISKGCHICGISYYLPEHFSKKTKIIVDKPAPPVYYVNRRY